MVYKILRTIGSFLYSSITFALIGFGLFWILLRCMKVGEGFWAKFITEIGLIFIMSWISEKGVEWLSIPYNWLWDRGNSARWASSVPPVLIGIWVLTSPFRVNIDFSTWDIVFIVTWELLSLFLIYNLVTLPWINRNMGVGCSLNSIYKDI